MTEVLCLLMAIRGTKVAPFFFQLEVKKWEQIENISNCKKCLSERRLHLWYGQIFISNLLTRVENINW